MKTGLDVTSVLFKKLNVVAVKSAITGNIYKDEKPKNSELEDIVINCLPVSADQPQRTTANVNIHVPDMTVGVNTENQRVPNHNKLKAIKAVVMPYIETVGEGDYMYSVASTNVFRDTANTELIMNIRIDFIILNN